MHFFFLSLRDGKNTPLKDVFFSLGFKFEKQQTYFNNMEKEIEKNSGDQKIPKEQHENWIILKNIKVFVYVNVEFPILKWLNLK